MYKLILTIFTLSLPTLLFSQHHNGGYLYHDSLEVVTLGGIVIIDESPVHNVLYLDENSDGEADYMLNFGPYWYEPSSSDAVRPSAGETVVVTAGVNDHFSSVIPVLIVYEINGQYWRDPFFANWNNMGTHNHYLGGHHGEGNGFYGFGWQHDTLETVTLPGSVLIDTTFFISHYYLDMDQDDLPDYFLNFGPPWYAPESGIERPRNGEQVSILGGKLNNENDIPMIIVYEINDEVWIDSNSIGPHFGGGWFNRNLNGSRHFHAPFDTSDVITVNEGWRNFGPGGGHMMPDSFFCQILEINPENLPVGGNFFAGYEIHMFRPDGSSGMRGSNGMGGGRMGFANNVQFMLHYSDTQLEYYNVDEETVSVKYWDDQNNDWLNIDFEIDKDNNLIHFSSSQVNNYLVLAAEEITDISYSDDPIIRDFILHQNYPNPFNPSTTISFQINGVSNVELNVFNMLGEKVGELLNRELGSGKYEVNFAAGNLPSGIYFYKLKTDKGSITKVMTLMK